MSKNISLTDDEVDEAEIQDENEEAIENPTKKDKINIDNLTQEQFDKINALINSNVNGITKKGNIRKSYSMTEKKKQHMQKLREQKAKIKQENIERKQKEGEEQMNNKINILIEQKLKSQQELQQTQKPIKPIRKRASPKIKPLPKPQEEPQKYYYELPPHPVKKSLFNIIR